MRECHQPTLSALSGIRRFVQVFCVLASLGLPAAAGAQARDLGPSLNWVRLRGADSCDGPVAMANRVEQRLGRPVFVRTPDAVLVVEGRVEASDSDGFATQLRFSDPDGKEYGRRTLQVPSGHPCSELDALASLAIAVTLRGQGGVTAIPLPAEISAVLDRLFQPAPDDAAIHAELLAHPSPAGPSQPAREPPPVRVGPSAAQAPAPEPASERRVEVGGGLMLAASSGGQPLGALGPAAQLRLTWPRVVSLLTSVSVALPVQEPVEGSDGTLRYRSWQLFLSLCLPEFAAPRSRLTACVAGGPARMVAEARDFRVRNGQSDALYGQVAPELRGRFLLVGPLHLLLTLRVPVRLAPPSFEVVAQDGTSLVALSVKRVGVGAELGLELGAW